MEHAKQIINEEVLNFETKTINIVAGFDFNQKNAIERIIRNYNSKFENGDIDAEGSKKYFFNVNRNPCKVVTKAIDFDTKHIQIQTAGGGNPLKTWYLERDFRQWMKEQNFGRTLNRIFEELSIFGSVVLKIVDGKPYFVDLRNFIVEQTADTLDQSSFIIERHPYTIQEFISLGKKMKWTNIDKAVEEHRKSKKPYIYVYERYGEMKNGEKYEYARIFYADVGKDEVDAENKITISRGFILHYDTIDAHPYFEFHLEKIPGRWLGIGIVEVLFDTQVRHNELANQEAKGTYWASLRVWQSRDESANKNLATENVNGEIIYSESRIDPIDTTDRNLAYFNLQTQKWLSNRDELTFSYDVNRGERLPAGTPLGSARLAAAMSSSHFDQIRENVALAVKRLLYDVIIPYFEKENSVKHSIRLAGEDLDKINQVLVEQKSFEDMVNYVVRTGNLPLNPKEKYEAMKQLNTMIAGKVKERNVEIPNSFYDDAKYKIDIIITGESKDAGAQAQVLFSVLQAMTADPTITQDPLKRQLLSMWLERGGISPVDLNLTREVQPLMETKMGGGGVSAPLPMTSLQNIPAETTI